MLVVANPWLVLGILFFVRLTLGFQFQTAGTAIPYLMHEYGTSYTLAGVLVGSYMLPGLVLAVPAGVLGKYLDEKTSVLIVLSVMMLGGVLAATSSSESELVVARVVSGAGATPVFISMTKMVMDRFDHSALFVAVGLFVLGWPAGIALGQITQPIIAETYSWRAVLLASAIACALALALTAALGRRPMQDDFRILASPCARALSRRELWNINVAGLIWMCLNGAYIIVISFCQLLLLQHGLNATTAGAVASMASWSFIIAVPFGGYIAHRFRISTSVMVTGLAVAALVAGLLPFASPTYLTFGLFGFAIALAAPVVASLPARLLHRDRRSVGLGTYFTWMFAGTAALPVVAGYVTDASRLAGPFMFFASALLIFCLIGLLFLRSSADWVFARDGERSNPTGVTQSSCSTG
jgi:MFS family permease